MHTETFYEIELKALITKEQYDKFSEILPKEYTKVNDDLIHSIRYRPGDIRLRYSNRIFELVHKTGQENKICKKETKIYFDNVDEFNNMKSIFSDLKILCDAEINIHKQDYEILLDEFRYIICLQNIKDYAYVLEVEYLNEDENYLIHERNIRSIFKRLNIQPIDPKEFNDRLTRYLLVNKKWL